MPGESFDTITLFQLVYFIYCVEDWEDAKTMSLHKPSLAVELGGFT